MSSVISLLLPIQLNDPPSSELKSLVQSETSMQTSLFLSNVRSRRLTFLDKSILSSMLSLRYSVSSAALLDISIDLRSFEFKFTYFNAALELMFTS